MTARGLVFIATIWTLAASVARAEDRALLIGVNDYLDQRVRDLRGCEDDALAVEQMLIEQFGFRADQIKMLLSREATRQAILDNIRNWLIDGTKAGDRVVLFNSSHGAQKEDENGDEADGLDEVLCPTDFNPETKVNAIIDDEIGELLKLLAGRNVTVLIDACHSGTITKSIRGVKGMQLRAVETIATGRSTIKFIPNWRKDIDWTSGGSNGNVAPVNGLAGSDVPLGSVRQRDQGATMTETSGGGGLIDDPSVAYVAFSACSSGQTAEEIEVEVGSQVVRRGAFTWFLVQGLAQECRTPDVAVTNRQLVAYLQAAVRNPKYDLSQTPELLTREAYVDQPFLGRPHTTAGDGVILSVASGEYRATINRGAQHGVERGQKLVACEAKPADARLTGRLEVENVEQFIAVCRITRDDGVKAGQSVRRDADARRIAELRVWVRAEPAAGELATCLRERVDSGGLPGVKIVDEEGQASLFVAVSRSGDEWTAKVHGRYGTLRSQQTAHGMTAALDGLVQRLRGERLLVQLSSFQTGEGDMNVAIRVDGGRTNFTVGESIRFRVRPSQDCHLTLLSIDSTGEVRLLLPNGHRTETSFRGGEEVLVPPQGQEAFEVLPPAGRDVIKVIATRRRLALEGVTTKSLREKGFVNLTPQVREIWPAVVRAIGAREQPDGTLELPATGWGVGVVEVETLPE